MTDTTTFLAPSERVKVFLSLRTENEDPQEGAFWRETLIEGHIFREWLLTIGQRGPYNRVAHLFREMLVRLRAVGLAEDHACDLPITQAEIADVMAVTTVHINRVLQQMRTNSLTVLLRSATRAEPAENSGICCPRGEQILCINGALKAAKVSAIGIVTINISVAHSVSTLR